jgi:peptide/nickel transport system substrate-binding protein
MLQSTAAAAMLAGAPAIVTAQGQRVLRIRMAHDLASLDPAVTRSITDICCIIAVLNKLVVYKSSDRWETRLDAAQAIDVVDPTHIRFTLRPGIMWTNNFGEMTAEDVKYSFERILDPKIKSNNAPDWKLLDRVDVVDKYTGVIVLKAPFPGMFLGTLTRSAGTIVSKKAVESVGGSYKTEPPATSGPYLVKEWRPKERIVLARNPVWSGPRPEFDEIHLRPVGDQKAAELAYEAGEIDVTDIAVSSVPKFQKTPPPGTKILARPLVGIEWIGINTEHPAFKDVRVRRAVQLAVDTKAVLDAAYFGVAKPATGIVAPGLPGYRAQKLYPNRDLARAKQLLAQAGVPNGFPATLSVQNNTDMVTAAQVVQANLAEIGIQLEIKPYESGTFSSLGAESKGSDWKNIQLYHQKWGLPPDPANMMQWFLPEQIGVWNWERWNDPEFAGMHKQALSEMDVKKRGELFLRMQDRMEESGAFVWLTNGVQAMMHRTTVEPATTPDGRWYIFQDFKRVG